VEGDCTILIGDRNPHVREFLRREMEAEGYHVQLAKNGREILKGIYRTDRLDLVILDLDLPDMDDLDVLGGLENRLPNLPVVIHTYRSEYMNHPGVLGIATVVEKTGKSIDDLKRVVTEILRKTHSETAKGKEE